jgi:hypothetical protein
MYILIVGVACIDKLGFFFFFFYYYYYLFIFYKTLTSWLTGHDSEGEML